MDSFDLDTRLPPRKRLLAGLRKESSDCDFSLPIPPVSTGLYAQLRDLFYSNTSSLEEIIEASRSATLAAGEIAARARANAVEKAAAAVKARAAATSALELVDLVVRYRDPERELKKKKQVSVKLLYKKKKRGDIRRTDEELARRLHRSMNSSARLSSTSDKKRRGYHANHMERGGEDRGTDGFTKVKGKPKTVLLSQCSMRYQGKPGDEAVSGESRLDRIERSIPLDNGRPSCGGEVPMKIPSVWKCKKFNVSMSSSGSKISHALCLDTAAPKASSMVKVDL